MLERFRLAPPDLRPSYPKAESHLPNRPEIMDFMRVRAEKAPEHIAEGWQRAFTQIEHFNYDAALPFLEEQTVRFLEDGRGDLHNLRECIYTMSLLMELPRASTQEILVAIAEHTRDNELGRHITSIDSDEHIANVTDVKEEREAWNKEINEAKDDQVGHLLERAEKAIVDINHEFARSSDEEKKKLEARLESLRVLRTQLMSIIFEKEKVHP